MGLDLKDYREILRELGADYIKKVFKEEPYFTQFPEAQEFLEQHIFEAEQYIAGILTINEVLADSLLTPERAYSLGTSICKLMFNCWLMSDKVTAKKFNDVFHDPDKMVKAVSVLLDKNLGRGIEGHKQNLAMCFALGSVCRDYAKDAQDAREERNASQEDV